MLLTDLVRESDCFSESQTISSQVMVKGICFDSRKVKPSDLFFALEGANFDGHQFINEAVQKGAVAVVGKKKVANQSIPYLICDNPRKAIAQISAAFYDFPARNLTVIGVTGTDGKTTTVNLIHQILLENGIRAGMVSTVNAVIGEETIDTGFHVTTPEAPTIQALLRRMVKSGLTHVVIEATSHGLDQYRVTACEFDVAVITNITHEHLDYHGDYSAYFDAKFRLVEELQKTVGKQIGNYRTAVINHDDRSFQEIICRLEEFRLPIINRIIYGLRDSNYVSASNINLDKSGIKFNLSLRNNEYKIYSPVFGEYNVHNILAAVSAAVGALGLEICPTLDAVRNFHGVPGRMESIDLGQKFLAIIDFAHTPNALKVALETAKKMTENRVIAIFGSAGLRDREKRQLMAAVSIKYADITILTAEDPRTEDLEDILREMREEAESHGAVVGESLYVITDRGEAIRTAVNIADEGDIVIACGKGHEQSMCFGEIEYPWDDRTAMKAALSERVGIAGPDMPYLPTRD